MPIVTTRSSFVSIGGISLATPAWDVLNIHVLWQGPEVRGSDRLLPGAAGVRPYRRRATVTRYTLELVINGTFREDGLTYANPAIGLQSNIDYLYANVVAPVATTSGTRAVSLVMPDGTTRTGHAHVEAFQIAPISFKVVRATMDISIPTGRLA